MLLSHLYPKWSLPTLPEVPIYHFYLPSVGSLQKLASSTQSIVVLPRRRYYYPNGSHTTRMVVVPLKWQSCYSVGDYATQTVVVLHDDSRVTQTMVVLWPSYIIVSASSHLLAKKTWFVCQLHFALFWTMSIYLSSYPYFPPYCKGWSFWHLQMTSC